MKKVRKKLASLEPSLAGFSLLLGLKPSDAPRLHHHTILFPENYDAEFDALYTQQKPVADPTIYICSPQDSTMAPSGSQSWFVLVNAPRHSQSGAGFNWLTPGVAEGYRDHLIELLVDRKLLDRSRIVDLKYRSPADIERMYNAPGGSIYGRSSNGPSAAFNRASNRSPISGLFLVGGSAHPGGGVPLVGISGEIVANAIASEPSR